MFSKVIAFLKKLRKKVSAGVVALVLSIVAIVGVALPSDEPISGSSQSVTNRIADIQVTTGNVQFLTDNAWVGRDTDNQLIFNGTTGNVTLDGDTAFLMDAPYAQFQADGAWVGRDAAASSIAFDAGGLITSTVGVYGNCRLVGVNTGTGNEYTLGANLNCNYSGNVISTTTATGAGNVVLGGYQEMFFGFPFAHPNEIDIPSGGSSPFGGSSILGGADNTIGNRYAVIGGGRSNTNNGEFSFIGAGFTGSILGPSSKYNAIIAGQNNTIYGSTSAQYNSAISGISNLITGTISANNTIGGSTNVITSCLETNVFGYQNTASCDGSGHNSLGILAGRYHDISGDSEYSVVVGGLDNDISSADYALVAGRRAKANNDGCFVWGDSTNADITCSNNDRAIFRSAGGYYIYTNNVLGTGMYLAAGGSAWNAVSDRDAKEDFATVDGDELLANIATMPTVETWQYKGQEGDILHVGAMADDFNSLVDGLGGEGQDRINQGDAIGVNLAAIQALTRKVDALEHGGAVTQSQAYRMLLTQPHIIVSASILLGCAMISLAVLRRKSNGKQVMTER